MHKSWVNIHGIYILLYALKPSWHATYRVGHMYSPPVSQVQRLTRSIPPYLLPCNRITKIWYNRNYNHIYKVKFRSWVYESFDTSDSGQAKCNQTKNPALAQIWHQKKSSMRGREAVSLSNISRLKTSVYHSVIIVSVIWPLFFFFFLISKAIN